jgi:hypothetical protein
MDERLKKALDFSNFRNTFEIQRKSFREKLDSSLTYGYGGGIFKIDSQLICFVEFLISKGREIDVPILDINKNPVLIKDLKKFQTDILDRYFSGCLDYFNQIEELKRNRSVEKLIDYE